MHLEGTLQQREAKHFLVPTDGAFDVGYADANMVYCPRVHGDSSSVLFLHLNTDYFLMN
jgi:hypothetical protein